MEEPTGAPPSQAPANRTDTALGAVSHWFDSLGHVAPLISIITVFCASAAVLFDFGFFYALDLNLFTLFTLSEHLLFAIETAPIFLTTLLTICLFIFAAGPAERYVDRAMKRVPAITWLALFCGIIVVGGVIWFMHHHALDSPTGTVVGAVIFACMLPFVNRSVTTRFTAFAVVFLLGSGLLGYMYGSEVVRSRQSNYRIILKAGEELVGNLIRSGERGILFHVRSEFRLLPWDGIASVRFNAHP
jgi:hypothetical protein